MTVLRAFYVCLFCVLLFGSYTFVDAETALVDFNARVAGCGDLIIDSGEECDTSTLGGASCASRGFTSGTLSCTSSCLFDTTSCVLSNNSGGGGSGSGSSKKTVVVFTGNAYPKSTVTILKDASIIGSGIAGVDGAFQISISDISSGSYVFSALAKDSNGVSSSLLNFPITVKKGLINKIDKIFISPSIAVTKEEVKKGDTINFSGQTKPFAIVSLTIAFQWKLESVSRTNTSTFAYTTAFAQQAVGPIAYASIPSLNSQNEFTVSVTADSSGYYTYTLNTTSLPQGDYFVSGRSLYFNQTSSISVQQGFIIGTENVISKNDGICDVRADINEDCKVNIIDFSILLYWVQKPLAEPFTSKEKIKLNGDGVVNLTDLSIIAFYWTG